MDWITYYLSMAFFVAMKSKDKNTHHGAVIVGPDNEIISTGYNGFCRGANDDVPERQERPEKYFWFEHAERNAIYNAARIGVSCKGATIYVTGIPCMDCARAIIQSGIKTVMCCTEFGRKFDNQKWKEQYDKSISYFQECGVNVFDWEKFPQLIRTINVRLNGEDL